MNFLKGRKTYLVAALTVLYVIYGAIIGQGLNVELLAIALTAAGVRNAIK